MENLSKWLAAIVGSIIAGLFVWWVTTNLSEDTNTQSFLERISGSYNLISWNETVAPITIGVSVKDGTLRIDDNGNANWDLGIWDSAAQPTPPTDSAPSRIKCGGRINSQTEHLVWTPGNDRNAAIDWERGIISVREMVWPAFCGGESSGSSAPFTLHIDTSASDRILLEMTNSKGTFRWVKQN